MLSREQTLEKLTTLSKSYGVTMVVNTGENITFTAPPDKHFIFDPIYKKFPKKTIIWEMKNLVGIIQWLEMYLSCMQNGEPNESDE